MKSCNDGVPARTGVEHNGVVAEEVPPKPGNRVPALRSLALLLCFLAAYIAAPCRAAAPAVSLSSPSLVAQARQYESQVRAEFKTELGHEPRSTQELLGWLDQKSAGSAILSAEAKNEMVLKFGATLGELLIRDVGGQWVHAAAVKGYSHAIKLPDGKLAFVFNLAARRIVNGDPIGFSAYFQRAAKLVKRDGAAGSGS
jgi:hypothetical protein